MTGKSETNIQTLIFNTMMITLNFSDIYERANLRRRKKL